MKRKFVTFSLAAVLGTSGLLLPYSNSAFAETLEQKKDSIQKKHSEVSSSISEKESEISSLKEKEAKLDEEMKKIDLQHAETNGKIREKNASIEETKQKIEELKVQIAEVKARIDERNKLLEDRARSLQESGGMISYLDVLLGAQSFGDFVGRVSAVTTIVDADRNIIKAHEEDIQLLKTSEADLNNQLKKLESSLKELETLKVQLSAQKAKKAELMKQVQAQHDEAVHEMHELEDEAAFLAEQRRAVEREQKRQQEEAARAAAEAAKRAKATSGSRSSSSSASSQKPAVTSGSFMWPASGSFTSGYGPRWGKLHAGIDIANGADVPIVASAAGTVIRSNYSSSYGNVVYISHNINGQVYTTVYAHMEARHVSAGQSVSKGQQIGIMGNTGRSTGQHLHFEIHKGGWNGQKNAVNPLNYLQ